MIIDNREVEVGDIFYNGHYYLKVLLICDNKIHTAFGYDELIKARNNKQLGFGWNESKFKENSNFIEHWNPTEAKDKNGKIIHIGGWVQRQNSMHSSCKVIAVDYVSNLAYNMGYGYEVYIIDRNKISYILAAKDCKVIPDQTIKPKINITVIKNGQPYDGKLSAETLRSMGILE